MCDYIQCISLYLPIKCWIGLSILKLSVRIISINTCSWIDCLIVYFYCEQIGLTRTAWHVFWFYIYLKDQGPVFWFYLKAWLWRLFYYPLPSVLLGGKQVISFGWERMLVSWISTRSNFALYVLDKSYKKDVTRREEAVKLVQDCFDQLRMRFVINSPEKPCIKCIDSDGCSNAKNNYGLSLHYLSFDLSASCVLCCPFSRSLWSCWYALCYPWKCDSNLVVDLSK
jgi:hypothetical protein